jgi:hypothetical protein
MLDILYLAINTKQIHRIPEVIAIRTVRKDHKGHKDRIFEQEETEDKSTHFIAGGCEPFYLCSLPSLLLSPSFFVSSVTFCKKQLIGQHALKT